MTVQQVAAKMRTTQQYKGTAITIITTTLQTGQTVHSAQ
jgi:hypothetical protein